MLSHNDVGRKAITAGREPANLPAVRDRAANLPAVRAPIPAPRGHTRAVILTAICVTLGVTATFLTGYANTAEKFVYACGMAMAVLAGLLIAEHLMTRRTP